MLLAELGVDLTVGHVRQHVEHADVVVHVRKRAYVDENEQIKGCLVIERRHLVEDLLDLVRGRANRLTEQLDEDLVLAGEVVVEGRLADADTVGDLAGGRRREALGHEESRSSIEDLVTW